IKVDRAWRTMTLAFAPGEVVLSQSDAARLHQMARAGQIKPEDRVTVAAAGDPALAQWREDAIARELLPYGIVATARPLGGGPPDRAIVAVGRFMVTLPHCPNWNPVPTSDFTNSKAPNFGCADAVNFGLMVANPADLVGGRDLAAADAVPAINAVGRYL